MKPVEKLLWFRKERWTFVAVVGVRVTTAAIIGTEEINAMPLWNCDCAKLLMETRMELDSFSR